MEKKIVVLLTIFFMFLVLPCVYAVNKTEKDIEINSEYSTVTVNVESYNYESFKIIVGSLDDEYIYNQFEEVGTYPLQMGSGLYTISILGSNDGRRYRLLSKESFNVKLEENAVFLSSSQTVNWNDESEVTDIAKALTKDAKTDREKLEIIHDYVINNVAYDYKKATSLPKGYIPSPEATFTEGLGICYDFAALTASMLRAVDVPTKLVKGYSAYTPVYHAWNEVLVDGEWIVIDTSTDSIFKAYGVRYRVEKNVKNYVTSKVY